MSQSSIDCIGIQQKFPGADKKDPVIVIPWHKDPVIVIPWHDVIFYIDFFCEGVRNPSFTSKGKERFFAVNG
jgi:hypothetical protein